MLRSLAIDNIVLIEKLRLDFAAGMSALTGETGAGKSIILDSLSLILGARADSGMIRQGAEQASVLAEFDLPPTHPVWAEIEADPSEPLLISRTISREGKSRAGINDRPATIETLKKIGSLLVDIHAQFDTHALLDPAHHRALLDMALPDQGIVSKTAAAWEAWQDLETRKAALQQALIDAQRQQEQWQADLEVLEELAPQAGEEDMLLEQRGRAQKSGRMAEAYAESISHLNGSEDAAGKALNRAWKALSRLPEDERLSAVQKQIDDAIALTRAASDELEDMGYALRDMQSAETIDDRIHALRAAARRLNVTCDELPVKQVEIAQALESLALNDRELVKLDKECLAARETFIKAAEILSKARHKRAGTLEKEINAELPPLKLEKARFTIELVSLDEANWGVTGCERVQFMAVMNAGQSASPLHKTASGGELSRLLLAIKMVLADVQPVLVFDEIDQGVGGATAAAIGTRLRRLSDHHQVIVVTHSAQVAASAHAHFVVQKAADGKQTRVAVTELAGREARRDEVARMLSGTIITNEAKAAAEKLMEGHA